jgi:transcriptional regulator with XRE-family HTH domain
MHTQNVVGLQIRRLRRAANLTQDQLTARCGVLGWRMSRSTLAKIESRVRCVSDAELYILARSLRSDVGELYPAVRSGILGRLRQSEE